MKSRFLLFATITFLFPLFLEGALPGTDENIAVHFSSTDYLRVYHDSQLTMSNGGEITIEAWIKSTNTGNRQAIVWTSNECYGLFINADGKLSYYDPDNAVGNSNSVVSDNRWNHVAITLDASGNLKYYINGELDNTQTGVYLNNFSSGYFIMGAAGLMAHYYDQFEGYMDEIRVWNTARTQTEIQSTIHQYLDGNEANLVAYYKLNEGEADADNSSNTTITDYSTYGNDGTLQGFSLSGTTSNWTSSLALWKRWLNSASAEGWGTTSNWSTQFSGPTANDMVLVRPAPVAPRIYNGDKYVKELWLEPSAILNIDCNSFTVHTDLTNEGTINLPATTGNLDIAGDFLQMGSFSQGAWDLNLNGTDKQTLRSFTSFSTININNSDTVTLNGAFDITDALNVSSGLINLNSSVVTLGTSANLNETGGRIFGDQGSIKTTRTINNLSSENVAGLGFEITTTGTPGSTIIKRKHNTYTNLPGNNEAIPRVFIITPTNSAVTSDITLHYQEAELGSLSENNLAIFVSDDETTWTSLAGTVDEANNTITVASVSSLHKYWTIGGTMNFDATFTVTDGSAPLENATIEINGQTLQTNATGNATTTLTSGTYPYTVSKSEHYQETGSIAITNQNISENVTLTQIPKYTVSLTVQFNGNPLENASIEIYNTTLTTNTNGEASIDVINGTHEYTISKTGNYDSTATVEINGSGASLVISLLETEYNARFEVTDATNNTPAFGAVVAIDGEEYSVSSGGIANANLINGTYNYTISKQWYDTVQGTIVINNSGITEQVDIFRTQRNVYFQVKNAHFHTHEANVTVSFQGETAVTNNMGNATLTVLDGYANQQYTLSKSGFNNEYGYLSVQGEDLLVEETIGQPCENVNFTVTDGTSPIEDVRVSLIFNEKYTNSSGNASFCTPNGILFFDFYKEGYGVHTEDIVVNGSTINKTVVLTQSQPELYFTISDGTVALEGVSIEVDGITKLTNGSGAATFDVSMGTHNYSVSKTGFETQSGEVIVDEYFETKNIILNELRTVTFNVSDETTALSGATITINSTTISTDASGVATIELIDGTYNYEVNLSGYETATGSVTVSGAAVSENVILTEITAPQYTVTFNVSDGTNGLSGAGILINSTVISTDASGVATIDLVDGTYNYEVNLSGYESATGSVTVSSAEVSENVTMTEITAPQYTVTFNVSDGTNGLSGAGILINSTVISTDASGVATIDLVDGTYNYEVNLSGYESATGSVTVSSAEVSENVTMTEITAPQYTVTFNVSDGTNGLSGAGILINSTVISTDASGVATIDLVDGTYNYEVNLSGYESATGSVTVSSAEVSENVTMTEITAPQYTVTFNVSDGTNGLSGAGILINSTVISTDASGVATIDLVDGTYNYEVNLSGYETATGSVTVSGAAVSENVTMTEITAPQYTVTFNVSDGTNGLSGAGILINSTVISTDASGVATIDLIDGTYNYEVNLSGYESATGSVTVSSAEVSENVVLTEITAPQYTVTFNVSDGTNVLPGAGILINSTVISTDASGVATIDLVDGTYNYEVNLSGYETATGSVTVSGAAVSENVTMTEITAPQYTVTFNVSDGTNGLSGAGILINSTVISTDASGVATIDLVDGTYNYEVNLSGYETATGSVTVSGAAVSENVILTEITAPQYTVTFNVSDGTNGLSGAGILINSTVISTDASGVATIDLVDGTYNYEVNLSGYETATGSVTVSGAAVTENVILTEITAPQYTVTFNVSDGTNGLSGAGILINSTVISTDASGVATIDLVDGTYNYEVNLSGYETATGSVTVSGTAVSENVTMTETTDPQYTLTISVENQGMAVNNAEITINNTVFYTGANGMAEILLSNGEYGCTIDAEGYESADTTIVINGEDKSININISATGIISNNSQKFNIYPNPTRDKVNIDFLGYARIQIITASGCLVFDQFCNTRILDLAKYNENILLIRIIQQNIVQTQKIILRR